MRAAIVLLLLAATACGAGKRRTLQPADVSAELGDTSGPFAELRLAWVETGLDEYDRFFREAAALQGALILAERAAAGEGEPARLLPVLQAVEGRAEAALLVGQSLLGRAATDFSHDEKKAMAIGPALHEAIGQVRDAAARAPGILARLQGGEPDAAAPTGGVRSLR